MGTKEAKLFREISVTAARKPSQPAGFGKERELLQLKVEVPSLHRIQTVNKDAKTSTVDRLRCSLTEHKPYTHQAQAPSSKPPHEHKPR